MAVVGGISTPSLDPRTDRLCAHTLQDYTLQKPQTTVQGLLDSARTVDCRPGSSTECVDQAGWEDNEGDT